MNILNVWVYSIMSVFGVSIWYAIMYNALPLFLSILHTLLLITLIAIVAYPVSAVNRLFGNKTRKLLNLLLHWKPRRKECLGWPVPQPNNFIVQRHQSHFRIQEGSFFDSCHEREPLLKDMTS